MDPAGCGVSWCSTRDPPHGGLDLYFDPRWQPLDSPCSNIWRLSHTGRSGCTRDDSCVSGLDRNFAAERNCEAHWNRLEEGGDEELEHRPGIGAGGRRGNLRSCDGLRGRSSEASGSFARILDIWVPIKRHLPTMSSSTALHEKGRSTPD